MRCVWCGLETSTRKDGKVFFCVKCNKPLVFELEDDYVEVIKASDFRLPQQPQHLQRQQQQQPQQQHRQRPQKQQPQKQPQQQQQSQLRAQQPRQEQQQKRERGQTTLSWW